MSDLESVLRAQARSWDIARERAERLGVAVPPPVITLSRELGVDGEAVARHVSAELGLTLYDREIVHAIAERSGVPETLLETIDEHAQSQVAQFIGALFSSDREAFAYARELSRVIAAVAQHGAALIVGHGAELVVPAAHALRVRVVAPLRFRVRMHAARHDLDLVTAEHRILEADREERAFCRQYFGVGALVPDLYDLVVNRANLSTEAAAHVIAAAYVTRFPGVAAS